MKKFSMETTVGIFMIIGIICIGYMAVRLGDVPLFGDNTYSIFARFSSVSGLKSGGSIEMLGIEVGKIGVMTLDQEKQMAKVELKIKNGISIYDDAIASIKTSGLIGDKYIQVDPGGAGDILKPGDTIVDTNSPLDIEDLIGKFAFGKIDAAKKDDKKDQTDQTTE
jgi:phospholipid/cholesterol/gamma-HCH transport system substrate-binding protein